jgi:NitT/TauT family transport system substrate-binding protein
MCTFKRRTSSIAVAVVLCLLVTACVQGSANRVGNTGIPTVTFQLDWVPGGYHAGFALAQQAGFYEAEGISVRLSPGNGSSKTAQLVAAGNAEIAYADATPVTQLAARKSPVRVLATLYQSPPSQLTARAESGIRTIQDVSGKSVAVPSGATQTTLLPALFEANGIDPETVDIVEAPPDTLIPQLLHGEVEAILGSVDSFGVHLADRGVETVDFPFYRHGVTTVGTSIFATETYVREHPREVRAFVKASLRGWAHALQNPDDAIRALTEMFPEVNADLAAKELQAASTLVCVNGARYVGKATDNAWKVHEEVLTRVGLLPQNGVPAGFYTYDYLPNDSELTRC